MSFDRLENVKMKGRGVTAVHAQEAPPLAQVATVTVT